MGLVKENFGSFIAAREDGALIGPFNPMLHFPAFDRAAWAMNKTMYEHTTPRNQCFRWPRWSPQRGSAPDIKIYGHEHLAESAGVVRSHWPVLGSSKASRQ
jgi:hypothetical protein